VKIIRPFVRITLKIIWTIVRVTLAIKNLSWKAARTIFKVRSNMIKIDSNFAKSESQWHIYGQNDTTRHLFECDDDLTIDMYNEIMKDGGPKEEMTVLEEYAARIQTAVQQRTELKKIMQQYGWAPKVNAPLQRSVRKKDRIHRYYLLTLTLTLNRTLTRPCRTTTLKPMTGWTEHIHNWVKNFGRLTTYDNPNHNIDKKWPSLSVQANVHISTNPTTYAWP